MELRRIRPAAHVAFLLVLAAVVVAQSAPAQGAEDAAAEKPTAVTTADPVIPADQLELLVKPLTTEELVVEADAWRDLLKKKVQQISQLQVAVKQQDVAAEQASASVQKQQPEAQAKGADEAQAAADRKQGLAETLPELQEDRANLVDRLGVVIDALEKKGGKVEAYRQYVSAISGLDIDVTDAATSWTLIKGWLASEQGGQRWAWNLGKFFVILIAGDIRLGGRTAFDQMTNDTRRFAHAGALLLGVTSHGSITLVKLHRLSVLFRRISRSKGMAPVCFVSKRFSQ